MAKITNSISYDGKLYVHPTTGDLIVEEVDKKTEASTYYNITKAVRETFEGKKCSITINEKSDAIEPIEGDPFGDEE